MPDTQHAILPTGDDGLAVGTGRRCVEEILGAAKVTLTQADEPVSRAGQEVIPSLYEARGTVSKERTMGAGVMVKVCGAE